MSERVVAVLRVDDDLVGAHPDVFGSDPAERCLSLATALSASPAWSRIRDRARLAVRPEVGLIGLFGSFQPGDMPLVAALRWQTEGLLRRLRPVSYHEVTGACIDLAAQLRPVLASSGKAYRLEPIPRGGHIVAGLLAYALGPTHSLPDPGIDADTVTVLVDDCALSGSRLRQLIEAHRGEALVVALLHAHPELRHRVMQSEPSVHACVAARDLVDHAPERPDYAEWKARWAARSPDDFWTGDPDHVCYPWNEPDALIWNHVTESAETAWRVVPPSWCLKNRVDAHPEDIQRCDASPGELRPTDSVIWANVGDGFLVTADRSDEVVLLRGNASAVWEAVIRTGNRVMAHHAVGRSQAAVGTDQGPEAIIEALMSRNLLHSPRTTGSH